MIFFQKLNTVQFFIEVERYFGEYEEEKRPIVFSFIKNLDDFTRGALLNELILNCRSGFKAPDVYIFNKYLQKAEAEASKMKQNCKKTAKNNKKTDEPCLFSDPIKELAEGYGLDSDDKNLWKKIIAIEVEKNRKRS